MKKLFQILFVLLLGFVFVFIAGVLLDKLLTENLIHTVIALIAIFLSFAFLRQGISDFYKARKRLKSNKKTIGEIIDRKEEIFSFGDHESISYLPIVRFTDHNQNIIEVILKNSYDTKRKCKIGKKVKILYSPKNSHNAVIKGLMFKEALSFCCSGIFCLLVALVMLIDVD